MAEVGSAYPLVEKRTDDYVRGRMSAEEELMFEIEFFQNPYLQSRVERTQLLQQVLAKSLSLNPGFKQDAETGSRFGLSESVRTWAMCASLLLSIVLGYLVLIDQPLTAEKYSAAVQISAATSPASEHSRSADQLLAPATVLSLGEQVLRSAQQSPESYQVASTVEQVVLGVDVGLRSGLPSVYQIELSSADGQFFQRISDLTADSKGRIYLRVNAKALLKKTIHYQVMEQGSEIIRQQGWVNISVK